MISLRIRLTNISEEYSYGLGQIRRSIDTEKDSCFSSLSEFDKYIEELKIISEHFRKHVERINYIESKKNLSNLLPQDPEGGSYR
jgi:hypothetical protein